VGVFTGAREPGWATRLPRTTTGVLPFSPTWAAETGSAVHWAKLAVFLGVRAWLIFIGAKQIWLDDLPPTRYGTSKSFGLQLDFCDI